MKQARFFPSVFKILRKVQMIHKALESQEYLFFVQETYKQQDK